MNFNTMLEEICDATTLSPEELYEFSRWMTSSFTGDDFDDEGNLIGGFDE